MLRGEYDLRVEAFHEELASDFPSVHKKLLAEFPSSRLQRAILDAMPQYSNTLKKEDLCVMAKSLIGIEESPERYGNIVENVVVLVQAAALWLFMHGRNHFGYSIDLQGDTARWRMMHEEMEKWRQEVHGVSSQAPSQVE